MLLSDSPLQQAARDHLLLHFSRNGSPAPLLVLERGEGPYVFDTEGNRYLDGLSSLFCAQIGYSYGEELASVAAAQLQQLAFSTVWGAAHPAAIELAETARRSSCPATSTTCSSRAAARSPSSPPGSSSASTTSPTASRSARRRSRATAPTTA